ncbi:MAG: riboflavin synthase [Candidatus Marinimicrobia bacterium]|nr:riboflavin synthase [Candidatus Neomarinimicrobiota bacterium]
MFTGIVEDIGIVKKINSTKTGREFFILSNDIIFSEIKTGDSLSINGVCLTLVEKYDKLLRFQIVTETLRCTNLGEVKENSYVNLERALKISDRIDGHILQGHVENVGYLQEIEQIGDSLIINIKLESKLLKYCIVKGSIGINGISLTIAKIMKNVISIAIIPHTKNKTTIGKLKKGDTLNIETDILSKYIENFFNFNNNKYKNIYEGLKK